MQEWLDRNADVRTVASSDTESDIPLLEGPWGEVPMRPMLAAVRVALPVLEFDPAEWGGILHIVGEPQQRWQEQGVPFYFVVFKGSIGGRKVHVVDCRPFSTGQSVAQMEDPAGQAAASREDTASPSIVPDEGPTTIPFQNLTSNDWTRTSRCHWTGSGGPKQTYSRTRQSREGSMP